MALRITLRDGEKMILNGAVLRAVGRTQLSLENNASVLRGRDIMNPDGANTPAKRLYFACMMAYIDPDARDRHRDNILILLGELVGAFQHPDAKATCTALAEKLALMQFYRALVDCRWLIAYEAKAMARVVPPATEAAGPQDAEAEC